MSPDESKSIIDVLLAGGPWSITAIFGAALRYVYVARERDRAKSDAEKQALNDRIIAMAERQNEVLEQAVSNQRRIIGAMEQTRALPSPAASVVSSGNDPTGR